MKQKPFKTYKQQIEILESRNLKFTDTKNAEYIIMNNSYYGLINGYKDLFILPKINIKDEDDYNGNSFDDIRRLYDFDNDLSGVLYKYLLKIENTIKTSLAYHISDSIGFTQREYLDPSNYKLGRIIEKDKKTGKNIYSRDVTLSIINKKITNQVSKPIKFYANAYKNVPPWIVINSLTLGNLVNWYEILGTDLKRRVSQVFIEETSDLKTEDIKALFLSSIRNVHYFRNTSAHGSRVYCSNSCHILTEIELKKISSTILPFNYKKHISPGGLFNLLIEICVLFSKRSTVRNRFINEIELVFADYQERDLFFYNKMMKQINMPFRFIDILRNLVNDNNLSSVPNKNIVSIEI